MTVRAWSGWSHELAQQAVARVETGSLTPALSRRERESRTPVGDVPESHSCEPSPSVPANPRPIPLKPAVSDFSFSPREKAGMRAACDSPCSSVHGSQVWFFEQGALHEAVARVETGFPHPGPLPEGEGVAYPGRRRAGIPLVRAVPIRSSEPPAHPSETRGERFLLLPPGEGRDEGRLRLPSLHGSWPVSRSF